MCTHTHICVYTHMYVYTCIKSRPTSKLGSCLAFSLYYLSIFGYFMVYAYHTLRARDYGLHELADEIFYISIAMKP